VAEAVRTNGSGPDTQWSVGTVLKVSSTAALFHFTGYPSDWDRWIPLERAAALIRMQGNRSSDPPSIGPEAEDGTTCICKTSWPHASTVACDDCDRWYHMDCVGVTKALVGSWTRSDVRYQCPLCVPPFGLAAKDRRQKPKANGEPSRKRAEDPAGEGAKQRKKKRGDLPRSPAKDAGAKEKGKGKARPGPPPDLKIETCRACLFGSHSAHTCGVRGYSGNEALTILGNPPSRAPSVATVGSAALPVPQAVIKKLMSKVIPSTPSKKKAAQAKAKPSKVSPPKQNGVGHALATPTSGGKGKAPRSNGVEAGAAAASTAAPSKPGRQKKREQCTVCKKTFASASQLKFHLSEHNELSEETAITEKMLRAGRGPDRGLNEKNANRKLVLVATPLAVRYGSGYPFKVKSVEQCAEIKQLIEDIPVKRGQHVTPVRIPFVYTNVKPEEGGEEGRAYQLNEAAVQKVLLNASVIQLLESASNGGLGQMGVDYKIDSVHHLHQTHSSWFERHIDKHSQGSLDFAIICMLAVENLEDDSEEATGCGVELFPWAQVHDESLNLVQGGSVGNSIILKIERAGEGAVFPGRWLYHRSFHSDLVGIRGILHKVVFFGYFLQSVVVPVAPLI